MKVNFDDALHISGRIINAYPMDWSVNLDPALLFHSGRRLDMWYLLFWNCLCLHYHCISLVTGRIIINCLLCLTCPLLVTYNLFLYCNGACKWYPYLSVKCSLFLLPTLILLYNHSEVDLRILASMFSESLPVQLTHGILTHEVLRSDWLVFTGENNECIRRLLLFWLGIGTIYH